LHWDGKNLLFVTDVNGNVLQVKSGPNHDDLAAPGGMWIYDRDPSGIEAGVHSPTQALGWTAGDDPFQQMASVTVPLALQQQGPILEPRSDGIWDGFAVIQGVRSSDPQTGAWTTPDEFPGSIHDPMSQKSFMWNRNDPVKYSDPSGFCIEDACIGEAVLVGILIKEAPEIEEDLAPAMARLAPILSKMGSNIVQFAQRGMSSAFSKGGLGAGQQVTAIANALRTGSLSASSLPVRVVVRNGIAYALNTRSLAALRLAGKPVTVIDMTGNVQAEADLTTRLNQIEAEGGDLGPGFTPVVRK
jgi:hypothetical protein